MFAVKRKHKLEAVWAGQKVKEAHWGLHPLIHTLLRKSLLQNVVLGSLRLYGFSTVSPQLNQLV